MKKQLLILTIFLLTITTGQAQTNVYHPFADSSAIWSESYYEYPCYCTTSCNTPCGSRDNYFINGDTIQGIYIYHKIYKRTADFFSTWTSPNTTTSFYGGIRQDIPSKKIYCFVAGLSYDTLLYNFNLNIGDTLPTTYNSNGPTNHVSSIDSILIGASYRKQYHISCSSDSDYVSLIEGIGCEYGLTSLITPPFESGNILNCYTQNNVTQYSNPNGTGGCNLTLDVKTEKNNEYSISVSPNPFASSTNLTTNLTDITVTIYNLYGQQVNQIKINSKLTVLTRDNLTSGLYFLRVTKDNKTVASDKLVIVDN